MFPKHGAFRIIKIQIMYTSLRKIFMDLNKHQGNGMRDLASSFLNKSLREVKLIKRFSLKSPLITFYLCRFMWMTPFLVPLTNLFVKILCTRCRGV